MTAHALGRHVEHDARSRGFPAPTAVRYHSVDWEFTGSVLDQGDLGSCTGNAAVQVLMCEPYASHLGRTFTERDALSVYSAATRLDDVPGSYPPNDTGSSGLAVMKALVERKLIRSYTHAFGIDHALGALMLGAVITGVDWYEGMFDPDPLGRVHLKGDIAGGHEFTVVGYAGKRQWVRCLNSWGPGWGDGGYFWLSRKDWGKLLAAQGDVTVPVVA